MTASLIEATTLITKLVASIPELVAGIAILVPELIPSAAVLNLELFAGVAVLATELISRIAIRRLVEAGAILVTPERLPVPLLLPIRATHRGAAPFRLLPLLICAATTELMGDRLVPDVRSLGRRSRQTRTLCPLGAISFDCGNERHDSLPDLLRKPRPSFDQSVQLAIGFGWAAGFVCNHLCNPGGGAVVRPFYIRRLRTDRPGLQTQ